MEMDKLVPLVSLVVSLMEGMFLFEYIRVNC